MQCITIIRLINIMNPSPFMRVTISYCKNFENKSNIVIERNY